MPVETRSKTGRLPPPRVPPPPPLPAPQPRIQRPRPAPLSNPNSVRPARGPNGVRPARGPPTIVDTLPRRWRRMESITPPESGIPYTEYRTDRFGRRTLVYLNRAEYCFNSVGDMGDTIVVREREGSSSSEDTSSKRSYSPQSEASSSCRSPRSGYTESDEDLTVIKIEESSVSPSWNVYALFEEAEGSYLDDENPKADNGQPPQNLPQRSLFLHFIFLLLHILLWMLGSYIGFLSFTMFQTIKLFAINTIAMCQLHCDRISLRDIVRFKLAESGLQNEFRVHSMDPSVLMVGITFGVIAGVADYFT